MTSSGANVTTREETKEASVILSPAKTLLRPTQTPGGPPLRPPATSTAGDGKKAVYGFGDFWRSGL